jgi:hypothetical protein
MKYQQINIYKTSKFYFIFSIKKTNTSIFLNSFPAYKLSIKEPAIVIKDFLEKALLNYSENYPHPKDWTIYNSEIKKSLKTIGLKSFNELYKNRNNFCILIKSEINYEIIPSKFDEETKSFEHYPEKRIIFSTFLESDKIMGKINDCLNFH